MFHEKQGEIDILEYHHMFSLKKQGSEFRFGSEKFRTGNGFRFESSWEPISKKKLILFFNFQREQNHQMLVYSTHYIRIVPVINFAR